MSATCQHEKCNAVAITAIIYKGIQYNLCEEHYNMLQEMLYKIAMQRGKASLELTIKKIKDGILKIESAVELKPSLIKKGEKIAEKYIAKKRHKKHRKKPA